MEQRMSRVRRGEDITSNPRDKRHGTYTGYNYHGCSCAKCRKANRDYLDARKKRILKEGIPDHVHGSHNGYANYGCRCDLCREATNKVSRERRWRRDGGPKKRRKPGRKPGNSSPPQGTVGVTWAEPPQDGRIAAGFMNEPVDTATARQIVKEVVGRAKKKASKPAPKPARRAPHKKLKENTSGRVYPWQTIPDELREWWISPYAEHGTATGYRYWGCRCDLCRAAMSATNRKSKKKV